MTLTISGLPGRVWKTEETMKIDLHALAVRLETLYEPCAAHEPDYDVNLLAKGFLALETKLALVKDALVNIAKLGAYNGADASYAALDAIRRLNNLENA